MSCLCQLSDLNLCLPVGTAPSWAIAIIDPETANTAVNITGATFVFTAKESPTDEDADAVFSLTSAAGEITITNAVSGLAQIDHTEAKTALLEAGRWYYWYLKITLSSGESRLARKGKFEAQYGTA